jgi:hypothetical protein
MNTLLPTREPSWMNSIASSTICQYFYIMFFVVAFFAGLVVLMDVYTIVMSRGRRGYDMLFRSILTFVIPVVNALFLYLLCARSILSKP